MIGSKAFYLKVRKQNVRWGCSCCQPVGRDLHSAKARAVLKSIIAQKDRVEARLIEKIERIEAMEEA